MPTRTGCRSSRHFASAGLSRECVNCDLLATPEECLEFRRTVGYETIQTVRSEEFGDF